jgi:pantoate ligase/cytidylate kinase
VHLFQTIAGLRTHLQGQRFNKTVGLVPTMGSLHPGHGSLISRAVAENDLVIVSIFVNPLQFSPTEDLAEYPRQLTADAQLCEELGVAVIFAPTAQQLGIPGDTPSQSSSTTLVVPPPTMTSVLCGSFRPGHFQGVATIVTKLFNIVQPTRAYFGEKDAQQVAIIRRLVEDLNIPVEIRACPTVREDSGLAYSSRNQYLSSEEKEQALVLSRSLLRAEEAFRQGEKNPANLVAKVKRELTEVGELEVQYVELVHPKTLEVLSKIEDTGLLAIACYLGKTRLIDSILLRQRQPIIAIDGPAGAGKSTVTRRVAEALGLLYLDTGAMYRAVTWLVMQSGVGIEDREAMAELVSLAKIELIPTSSPQSTLKVFINEEDVTEAIRTPQVTALVSTVAAQEIVRQELLSLQRKMGEKGGIVAEGRDIGTKVFPDAELKIFLTASVAERARRRLIDLKNQGETEIDLGQLQRDIERRDEQDSKRAIAPLRKAVDAIEIITDGLTIDQVTEKIVKITHKLKL